MSVPSTLTAPYAEPGGADRYLKRQSGITLPVSQVKVRLITTNDAARVIQHYNVAVHQVCLWYVKYHDSCFLTNFFRCVAPSHEVLSNIEGLD